MTRFAQLLKGIPTEKLERDISELLTDLRFLEDQISSEPSLYKEEEARTTAEKKLSKVKEKLRLTQDEYKSRRTNAEK